MNRFYIGFLQQIYGIMVSDDAIPLRLIGLEKHIGTPLGVNFDIALGPYVI